VEVVFIKLGRVHINQNALRVKIGRPVFLIKHHVCGIKIVSNTEKRRAV
jgi:hypothetical protein